MESLLQSQKISLLGEENPTSVANSTNATTAVGHATIRFLRDQCLDFNLLSVRLHGKIMFLVALPC